MRKKILKTLRAIENGSYNTNYLITNSNSFDPEDPHYSDYLAFEKEQYRNNLLKYITADKDEDDFEFQVIAYILQPNTQFLHWVLCNENDAECIRTVQTEIKRMVSDNLVLLGEQSAHHFVLRERGDFSKFVFGKGWFQQTDGITLTTKGKGWFLFAKQQINSEPIAIAALIVSILSLAISVWFGLNKL